MKRGCAIGLVTWAVCGYGYWYFTHARLRPPLDWIIPVAAGLLMAFVIGTLRTSLMNAGDAMRIAGQPGVIGEKPRDGAIVSVTGRIRSSGSPMRAPISNRPAVMYSYEVSHSSQTSDGVRLIKDYSGFGMSGAIIDSSYGAIRLLGFPMLDAFESETLEEEEHLQNATKYVASTQFTDLSGFKAGAMYRELKDLLTDDDGQVRKDWRMAKDVDLTGETFAEQIVAPGEQVSAIGRYSAEKGGLIPDIGRGRPLQLMRGDAKIASGQMWHKMSGNIVVALIFAAIVNGVLFGALKLHQPGKPIAIPKSAATLRQNIEHLHDAAREGDIARMQQIVADDTLVDARDDEQATPLLRASDPAAARWLIEHGADVNAVNYKGETALMLRAHDGNADVVKLLIKSGANLDTVNTEWKSTAIQMALDTEHLDVARILHDAGAKDDTVTEINGRAITESSDEVGTVQRYLDAIQNEDAKALDELHLRGPFESTDFKLWKSVRFAKGRIVTAFANTNAATITMRGQTPAGTYVTWTYQLARKGETWKIADERWETRFDGKEP